MNKLFIKTAIISGGAQGIGKGIARHFLEQGMRVVIADIDAEAGNECLQEYKPLGDIYFIPTDVSNEASVAQCIKETVQNFEKIDALVNNAGIGSPPNRPIEELSLEDWNRVIAANLTGCFLMTKYAAPHLKKSHGAIVNISSTRALQSEANTEAYSASKGGIVALTHALAVSLGEKVRVNCISPGWIEVGDWQKSSRRVTPRHTLADQEQHPAGRVGKPADVAALAAFLISDAAGFITGQNFVVDGGMTKKMIYAE